MGNYYDEANNPTRNSGNDPDADLAQQKPEQSDTGTQENVHPNADSASDETK